jgi:hypothetical protein
MKSQLRPYEVGEDSKVSALLCEVFGSSRDFPSVRSDQIHWKYHVPRRDYLAARGWIIERDGEIVAHCGVWPVWLRTVDGEVSGLHAFDWAAKAGVAGVGATIFKQLNKSGELACAVGGSDDALKILPVLGFRSAQPLTYWARPARPMRQSMSESCHNARWLARWARRWYWRYWPPIKADWRVETIAPDQVPEELWPHPEPNLAVFRRSAELFRYLAGCPTAQICLYRAVGPNSAGYFCLCLVPGVARIIDLWTPSTAVEDWAALYASAYCQAITFPDVNEVVTLAGILRANQALRKIGFRARGMVDLTLAGKAGLIQPGREIHFQWADNDKGFWHMGVPAYRS